jgi:oxygen-independent coproporphyrinogen-3 oxidase
MIEEYMVALLEDLEDTFDTIKNLGMKVTTVYIGGGTPTTLSADQLRVLLSKISEHINVSELLEFTLEAGRPDTITREKLEVAKEFGVTRVSVNPQTLSNDILREIGRRHTVEDFFNAFALAKEIGFRDINVDLIAGLPGDDFKNFSETVDKIIELDPTNITVHTFCVKKASDALKNNSNIYVQNFVYMI